MRYIRELDGLRAVAAVAVVMFHSDLTGPFTGGFVGVDLFFVLSAFLITGILDREWRQSGTLDLKRFYWRRFLRLMPALLLFLCVYLAIAPFFWPNHNHGRDALLTGLYLSDYSFTFWNVPQVLQHTWSLGVEEKFYLLWPLLLVPLLRSRNPLPWLAGAYVLATLWRSTAGDFHDYYYRFDTRTSGLILGALLFFALPHLKIRPWIATVAAVEFGAICLLAWIEQALMFIPLAEISAALLIAAAATGSLGLFGPVLRSEPFIWVGRLSYGIYLWHFPIAVLVRDHFGFFATGILTLALSTALAAFSWITVEAWARRLKSGARIDEQEPLTVGIAGRNL